MRNTREFLTDSLMTLAFLNRCAPVEGIVGDRLKVTKLLWLLSESLFSRRLKGLNFSFYRYSYGPFTKELYETWEDLNWAGLLEIGRGPTGSIGLTEQGRKVADDFYSDILSRPENEVFRKSLEDVATRWSRSSTSDLLQYVYSMRVRPIGWSDEVTIGNAPQNVYLTRVLEETEARQSLILDNSWLRKFDLMRHQQQARTEENLSAAYAPVGDEVLAALDEALARRGERGAGRRITLEELREKYGTA